MDILIFPPHTRSKRWIFIFLSFSPEKIVFHTPFRQYSSLYFLMFDCFSAITMVLNALSRSNSISYQGFFTVGLDLHSVLKLSSLAKSMIHMSSLQLELAAWCRARLGDMMGASAGGN